MTSDEMNPTSPNYRFGFTAMEMLGVHVEHAEKGIMHTGCYIPTRAEVMTLEPKKLIPILMDWMWESPSHLIATDEQEKEVIGLLEGRPDADTFKEAIDDFPINWRVKHPPERTPSTKRTSYPKGTVFYLK